MSTQPTAGTVLPLQLAKKNARWRGQIPVSAFDRLRDLLTAGGPAEADLQFSAIDRSSCRVTGRAVIDAAIECQVCLEEVPVKVAAALDFTIVRSEQQAREIASYAEPFLLHGESIEVAELIEDDLVLSLPTRGCDADAPCPNRPEFAYPAEMGRLAGREGHGPGDETNSESSTETGSKQSNPFAVLAELKQRKDQ